MTNTTKNGLLVAAAVLCGVGLSAKPWMLAREEQALARDQVRQAEADEARMVRDQEEESRLNTELGKEERLRGEGYHKMGEKPFLP